MAPFAPTVPNPNIAATPDPEYTSYRWSRPIGPYEGNKAGEIALKGGAEALKEGTHAANTAIENHLATGIESDVRPVQEAFKTQLEQTLSGIRGDSGALAYAEADGKNKLDILTSPPKGSEVPSDVKDIGKTLESMVARKANGSISETKYLGDLASKTSQWRAAWPGYTKEIDAEVDRVTQRGIANDYIKSMVGDLNAYAAAAKEGRSKVESLLQHAQEVDHIPGSDQWDMMYKAGRVDEAWVRHKYNESMLGKYQEEQAKTAWGTTEATDKNRAALGERVLNHNASNTIANVVATIGASMKPELVQQQVRNNDIDPATATAVATQYNAVIEQARAAYNNELLNTKSEDGKRTLADDVPPERAKKLFDDNPRIQMLKSTVELLAGKKDVSVALLSHNMLEGHIQDDQWKLASSDTLEGRSFRAIKTWAGTGVEGKIIADLFPSLPGALGRWATNQQVWGGAQADKDQGELFTFKKGYDEALANGQKDSAAFKQLAEKISTNIANPKMPDRLKEGYMEYAYDGSNLALMEQLADDHRDPQTGKMVPGKVWFYQNLTQEGHAAEVAKVARNSGHPEIWDKYQHYVDSAGTYIVNSELSKLETLVSNPYVKISYDDEAHQFSIKNTSYKPNFSNSGTTPYRDLVQYHETKDAQDSINKVNTVLRSVSTMSKYAPGNPDPNVYALQRIQEMSPDSKLLSAIMATAPKEEEPKK